MQYVNLKTLPKFTLPTMVNLNFSGSSRGTRFLWAIGADPKGINRASGQRFAPSFAISRNRPVGNPYLSSCEYRTVLLGRKSVSSNDERLGIDLSGLFGGSRVGINQNTLRWLKANNEGY